MNFFDKTGVMAIGSRLRMLSERITEDSQRLYKVYDVDIKPKWFPVFYVLSHSAHASVTEISVEIGHSHPSVVRIVREMINAGILLESRDREDGRRTIVSLTDKGTAVARKIEYQYRDVTVAIENMLGNTQHNLWKAIEEFEYLLDRSTLYERIMEQKKIREAAEISLVPYAPVYRDAFRQLNEAWIIKYFTMEESDRKMLEQPEKYIIDKGGEIIVALHNNEPVGVCALVPMDDAEYDFELAKMAVSPTVQGMGIGYTLGLASMEAAKKKGAKKLYLESNTVLTPALNLYRKLGFRKITGHPTPYSRCNIQMGLDL